MIRGTPDPNAIRRPLSTARARACLLVLALALTTANPKARQAATAAGGDVATGQALLATIAALTAPGMDGRATGTPGNAKARAWIIDRLTAIGVVPMRVEPADASPVGRATFEHEFGFTAKTGASMSGVNLVATCAGRRSDVAPIVVSAHYDHLGIRDGQTYHGADDNASGVAMLLHVAERCAKAPLEHRLILAFFDAEEQGLQGARAFLQSRIAVVPFALNVNFDMVSRSDTREIYIAGPGRWPALGPLLAPLAKDAPVTVRFGHDTGGGQDDWTTQSDHGAFHAAGIPFVYFGVEDHADYHKPTDTAEKIAPEFLGGVATVVWRALTALDRAAAYK